MATKRTTIVENVFIDVNDLTVFGATGLTLVFPARSANKNRRFVMTGLVPANNATLTSRMEFKRAFRYLAHEFDCIICTYIPMVSWNFTVRMLC
jgi:hypothetical protein